VKMSKGGVETMIGGLSNKTTRITTEKHLYLMSFFDVEDMWRSGTDAVKPTTDCNSSRKTCNPHWSGTDTWEDALALGEKGWFEGVEQIENILKKVQTAGQAISGRARSRLRGVSGSRVDVPRALSGSPYCMTKRRKVRTKDGTHIKVAVNLSASAGISAEKIMRRGGAICALISRLELDGYAVELVAYEACQKAGKLITFVPVKRPEDVLNIERVAMTLAHPSTLRRAMFAVQERLPQGVFNLTCGGSYGRPADLTDSEKEMLGITLNMTKIGTSGEGEPNWDSGTDEEVALWVQAKWELAIEGAQDGT